MELSKSDIQRLQKVGYDPSGTAPRSGSFLTKDHEVLSSEKKEENLEILPLETALQKYPWMEELSFGLVPVEKDGYTREVARRIPVGYFIRALPGAQITRPVQSCFFIKKFTYNEI